MSPFTSGQNLKDSRNKVLSTFENEHFILEEQVILEVKAIFGQNEWSPL